MKNRSVVLVSAIGLATACVILISVFTYKRYISGKFETRQRCEDDQHTVNGCGTSLVKHEDNDEQNVSQTESLTSYESFDDDTDSFSSVRTSSSEKSCVSTDADEHSPFPVGEISTYSKNFDADSPSVDFHEILNSPVIEVHVTDKRMLRSPISSEVTSNDSGFENSDITDGLEAKVQSIVVTYHTIVPPLKPNTGEIIPVPKM